MRSSAPNDGTSDRYDSAGSQRSLTAKISTAMVAIRNSGTATVDSVSTLSTRSSSEPRNIADEMPISSATGTETSAVSPASTSEFGRRVAISSLTGRVVRQRSAEVAADDMKEPLEVALQRRLVETELVAQCRDGFGRGGLAERLLRGVAGEQPGDARTPPPRRAAA